MRRHWYYNKQQEMLDVRMRMLELRKVALIKNQKQFAHLHPDDNGISGMKVQDVRMGRRGALNFLNMPDVKNLNKRDSMRLTNPKDKETVLNETIKPQKKSWPPSNLAF